MDSKTRLPSGTSITVDPKDWADFWQCTSTTLDSAFVKVKPTKKKRKKSWKSLLNSNEDIGE